MIFFRHTSISEALIKFEAVENDLVYGSCLLDLSEKNAVVTDIVFREDKPYLAEGIIKAAFNFAALKNFYMGECKSENISSLLEKLGFVKSENTYVLDIPSILTGSCCKK